MNANGLTRKWAKAQALRCQVTPIPANDFKTQHKEALQEMCKELASTVNRTAQTNHVPELDLPPGFGEGAPRRSLSITTSALELWSSFRSVLRFIPNELLTSNNHRNADIRRIITGHLHDVGPRQYFHSGFPIPDLSVCFTCDRHFPLRYMETRPL
jgi:senataxin